MKPTFAPYRATAVVLVTALTGYLIFRSVPLAMITWACGLSALYLVCSYIHEDAKAGRLSRVLFETFVVLPCIAFTAISLLNQLLSDSVGIGTRLLGSFDTAGAGVGAGIVFALVAALFGGLLTVVTRKR